MINKINETIELFASKEKKSIMFYQEQHEQDTKRIKALIIALFAMTTLAIILFIGLALVLFIKD